MSITRQKSKVIFNRPEENIESAILGEDMTVADFGAGPGHHLLPMARKVGEFGSIYPIDIQKEMVGKIIREAEREKLKNVHPIWGNVEKAGGSNLKDKTADRVLLINTLFQLEDKREALKEAKRILKKNGALAIVDWQDSFNHMGPHPSQVITKREAKIMAESLGFKMQKEFEAGLHHYGMLFRLAN